MSNGFDPTRLRFNRTSPPTTKSPGDAMVTAAPAPSTKQRRFLKGPIPLDWLERAGRTRGKGLHVGIALWLAHGLTRSDEVRLSLSAVAEQFGFHRSAASHGLRDLEGAGLVRVVRRSGRATLVKLIYEPVQNTARRTRTNGCT